MNPSYREQADAKHVQMIREIIRELPQACGDYLRAITITTSSLTRLAYAIDLKTFFQRNASLSLIKSSMK